MASSLIVTSCCSRLASKKTMLVSLPARNLWSLSWNWITVVMQWFSIPITVFIGLIRAICLRSFHYLWYQDNGLIGALLHMVNLIKGRLDQTKFIPERGVM